MLTFLISVWYFPISLNQEGNVYVSHYVLNLMIQKGEMIGKYINGKLNSQENTCTMMIIQNLIDIFWIQIPCKEAILEQGTIFCMHKSSKYYKRPSYTGQDRNISINFKNRNSLLFTCKHEMTISSLHIPAPSLSAIL